jgi:hypothetical protein
MPRRTGKRVWIACVAALFLCLPLFTDAAFSQEEPGGPVQGGEPRAEDPAAAPPAQGEAGAPPEGGQGEPGQFGGTQQAEPMRIPAMQPGVDAAPGGLVEPGKEPDVVPPSVIFERETAGEPKAQVEEKQQNPMAVPASVAMTMDYAASSDFEDLPGGYSHTRANLLSNYKYFSFDYEFRAYSWSDSNKFTGGKKDEPFEMLHHTRFGLDYYKNFDSVWGWFAGGDANFGFEDKFERAFGYTARAGLYNHWTRAFTMRMGISTTQNEVQSLNLPVIIMDWNAEAQKRTFSGTFGFPVTEFRWHLNDTSVLSIGGKYENRCWYLSNTNTVAPKGYFSTEDIIARLGYTQEFFEGFTATVGITGYFKREESICDSVTQKLYILNPGMGVGAQAGVEWRF